MSSTRVPTSREGLKRAITKSKVNVVSKASLALLNPAYAMGIENSFEESEDSSWKPTLSDFHPSSSSSSSSKSAKSAVYGFMQDFANDSTPELAAFTIDGTRGSLDFQEDVDDWEHGFGISSASMQRKTSNNSVFEDDEQTNSERSAGRRTVNGQQSSNSTSFNSTANSSRTLSRFFSRKRSNSKASNGTKTPVTISNPQWDVPASAPAHYTTFEAAAAGMASPEISNSRQGILKLRNPLSRKSSMPTLREVRRIAATSSIFQHQCQPQRPDQSKSILWSDGYTRPSLSNVAPPIPAHARLVNPRAMNNRPISSVGKGARKSSYDNSISSSGSITSIILTPEIPEDLPSPTTSNAPKKVQKKKPKRWDAPNVPPLPSLEQMMGPAFSATMKPSIEPPKVMRRRSKSVDAILSPVLMSELPSLVTPEGLFDTSIEKDDQEEVHGNAFQEAQRVNLSDRPTVIGTSSPKLVNFSPRLVQASPTPRSPLSSSPSPSSQLQQRRNSRRKSNRNSSSTILAVQRLAAPVVVNVMPPTPDLGADEYATFNGEIPSPGVRRSLEMSDLYYPNSAAADVQSRENISDEKLRENQSALDAIAKGHGQFSSTNEFQAKKQEEMNANHRRTQSTISDMSDFSTSAASESGTSTTDEPFAYTRSLSMISMLSSHDSGSDSSPSDEDDSSDEDSGSVEGAQIICVSPSTSSFSKAQLVSPRAASLASPRFPNKASTNEDGTETSLAASILSSSSTGQFTSSSCSSTDHRRDSQRFGGSLSSLSSGQSLASVMTACTSVVDHSRQGSLSNSGVLKKAVFKRLSNGRSDLGKPAEIESMLDSFGVSAANVQEEDDCDTPRLSGNVFAAQQSAPLLANGFQSTKPLNVRKPVKNLANGQDSSPPSNTAQIGNPTHQTPEKDNKKSSPLPSPSYAYQTLTPGLSPTPMRPYPRAQNSSSPHLELDLSLPLDLHEIGLGFEVEEDKPKRRGKGGKSSSSRLDQERPRLPTKSRARRQSVDKVLINEEVVQKQIHPKTPPSSGKLLASAMEHDAAMGLGLDFGFEGLNQEVERMRGLSGKMNEESSNLSAVDALGLTFEEHTLLSNAGKRSSRQRVNILRSENRRPGTADSVCSTATVRATPILEDPSNIRHVYGDVGFAL